MKLPTAAPSRRPRAPGRSRTTCAGSSRPPPRRPMQLHALLPQSCRSGHGCLRTPRDAREVPGLRRALAGGAGRCTAPPAPCT
eukprot:11207913-Lingulodinium_polyedra.AAC.1